MPSRVNALTPPQQQSAQALSALAVQEDYQRARIPVLDGGMRTDVQADALELNQSPSMLNVILFNQAIVPDTGYGQFGSILTPFFGSVQVAWQVFNQNGTSVLLLITTSTIYLYDTQFSQWQIVPWGAYYTNTAQVNSDASTINLSAVAIAATGNFTFTGQPAVNDTLNFDGTTVTFVASGASGNQVNIGVNLAGTLSNLLTFLDASSDANIVKMTYAVVGDVLNCTAATAGTAGNAITLGANSTAVEINGTLQNPLNLTGGTAIVNGSFLGLPLDDGEQLPVTVTNVTGTTVTFTPTVPSPRHVPNSSNICLGSSLHGSTGNQVSVVTFAPKEWTILTNQTDPIIYFDGTALWPLITEVVNTTCVSLLVFHESMYLVNTTENGQAYPQRVRASDLADPTAWTPGGKNGQSIAAIYDLLDTEDFIDAGMILGPYLILYRETTIMQGTYLGLLDDTIFWQYMVYGEGTISPGAISEIGALHEFVGNGDIYTYDGSFSLTGVGSAIFLNVLSAVGTLNAAARDTLFTQYNPDYDEFWMFYPTTGSATPNAMFRQSLEKQGWFQRQFANSFCSASPYLPQQTQTWESWTGTWQEQTLPWNSRLFLANVASILFCSTDTNQVYVYDYKSTSDAGTTIAWSFQTKDIAPGDVMERFDTLRVYGTGTAIVEYSIDGGNTFQPYGGGTLSLGPKPSLAILTQQVVSSYIRFQFSGTDPTFSFRWCECWYIEESEW